MKRALSNQAKAMAIPATVALALSLALGTASVCHADAKNLWNPKSWFSGSTQAAPAEAPTTADATVTDAQKKAAEAQEAANQAMQQAQAALKQAAEARKQAEALSKASNAHKKHPVVIPAAQTETQTKAETEKAPSQTTTERVYQAPAETPASSTTTTTANASTHKEPWNPLTWFNKNEDKETGIDGSIPQEKATQAVLHDSTPKTETASEQGHGNWTLKNLFSKPTTAESTQTASTTKAETATQTTTPTTEKSATTTETATTNTQTKSGGWNLLNMLSKPASPADSQALNQQAKEAEKAAQPDSEETDQSVKTKAALIETEKGNIAIELFPDQAPQTVANFVKLVNEGFYNRYNMKFHRVVPGFVIQTGDPTGTGAGGSKERVPLEAKNKLSHNAKGIVAMARGADPNSASSQFYITLAPQITLDGKYAIFGKVISGMDVLSKIEKDDMMYGIRLVDLSSIVRDPQPEKKKFFSSLF